MGPCSYRVLLNDRQQWRCHIDQLCRHIATTGLTAKKLRADNEMPNTACQPDPPVASPLTPLPPCEISSDDSPGELGHLRMAAYPGPVDKYLPSVTAEKALPPPPPEPTQELRHSGRSRHLPTYLTVYACAIQEERGAVSSRS